jgi:hypothetical protein
MSKPRPSPRPRFELRSKLPPEEIQRRLRALLHADPRLRGVALVDRVELSMSGEDLRFWSPQLVADVEKDDAGGVRMLARFGPDPYVWGLYVLTYIALTFLTFIALAFGISQMVMGITPTGLYVAPAGAVLAGLVYGASFVGQGLGSEQMYLLRATLAETAEAHEHDPEIIAPPAGGPEG